MGTWLKHDVITVVNAPLENVWDTWSDLDSMSLWMSWIESVKTLNEETNTLPVSYTHLTLPTILRV